MIVEIQISELITKTAVNPVPGQDQHNNQGIGTDLFVRKNMPGSTVGRGYTIDIFENGIKVDTVVEHNKERVLELVKKYKNFYHTDRAFQNEIQLHVTYKRRKDEEKTSMDLSQELNKRASIIQALSQKLIFPYENVKKFADEMIPDELGAPPVHQVTPSEAMNDTSPSESVDSIVSKTLQKLVDYISSNMATDDGVLYNELKKWYKSLGDIISENNQANPDNELDRGQISQKVKEITLAGDPAAYSEIGIEVTPEVAKRIQEVNGKAVSSKGGDVSSDASVGGETTAEKAASIIDKFLGGMRRAEDGKEFSEADKQFIEKHKNEITTELPASGGTEAESKLLNAAKNPNGTNPLQPTSQVQPTAMASEFWKYVKTASVVGDLDKVFTSWANGKFSSLEELGSVWSTVYAEATGAFVKYADMLNVVSPGTCPIFEEAYKKLLSGITGDNNKNQELVLDFNNSKPAIFSELLKAYMNSEYPKFKTNLKSMEIQAKSKNRFTQALTSLLNTQSKYYNNIHPEVNFSLIWTETLVPFITEFESYALHNYNRELKLITG